MAQLESIRFPYFFGGFLTVATDKVIEVVTKSTDQLVMKTSILAGDKPCEITIQYKGDVAAQNAGFLLGAVKLASQTPGSCYTFRLAEDDLEGIEYLVTEISFGPDEE